MALRISSLGCFLCVFLWIAAASAEQPRIPGYEGEVQKVLERAIREYRTIDSYQDRLVMKVDIDSEAEGDEDLGRPPTEEISLSFIRPGRISLNSSTYTVKSDGRQLWQLLAPIEQYTVSPTPEQLDLEELTLAEYQPFHQLRHPVAFMLTDQEVTPSTLLGEVTSFTGVKPGEREGQSGKVVRGAVKFWQAFGQFEEVAFDAWFSDKTGLVGEILYDHTPRVQKALASAPIKISKYHQIMRFESVEVNASIPDETFVFKPGPYEERVQDYRIPQQDELQQRMVGRPAPPFEARDLEGKPVSLADFKGQVVVLDFWATWCGPCILAMPHIQKLAEHYADKPVAVLGVNIEGPGASGLVSRFLRQRKFTYRQVMDNGMIAESYRSHSLPYLVLIDRRGTIRLIERGYHADQSAQMTRRIDELLKEDPQAAPASTNRTSD